jgi:hypothetical protein
MKISIKYFNYYFIQYIFLNNVPEEIEGSDNFFKIYYTSDLNDKKNNDWFSNKDINSLVMGLNHAT